MRRALFAPDATLADAVNHAMTERQWSDVVLKAATAYGWRSYHSWISIRSVAGWPDLVLLRPPRLLFVELKAEKGTVSTAQREWLAALAACPGIETAVWKPSDWIRVVEALQR